MQINCCAEKSSERRRPDCYPLKDLLPRSALDWYLGSLISGGFHYPTDKTGSLCPNCTDSVVYDERTCFLPGRYVPGRGYLCVISSQ